jgi:hypothetical protein
MEKAAAFKVSSQPAESRQHYQSPYCPCFAPVYATHLDVLCPALEEQWGLLHFRFDLSEVWFHGHLFGEEDDAVVTISVVRDLLSVVAFLLGFNACREEVGCGEVILLVPKPELITYGDDEGY